MFRNVRYYRYSGDWPGSEEAVSAELTRFAFKPCGPLSMRSAGWVPIDPAHQVSGRGLLARRINGAELIRLRTQSRVLPPAVINEALEERIEEYRARMGEDPTPREKRRLKAETREELLSQALRKSERTWAYIDPAEKLIGIDASSPTNSERFLSYLRQPFDVLTIKPLAFKEPIDALLTKIFLGEAPARFNVGRECRMQDATDAGSSVRWTNFDLADRSIRNHVADGMRLTHLAIEYGSILNCVIDQHGVLSKLKLLGADDKDTQADNDPFARQDAEFVLLTGTLQQLMVDLKKLLGGFA
jgi:recombination associated protein RdgC